MTEKESEFAYKKTSAWEQFSDEQHQQAYAFTEEYKTFLARAKTERETIQFIKEKAEGHGNSISINREKEAAVVVRSKTCSRGFTYHYCTC